MKKLILISMLVLTSACSTNLIKKTPYIQSLPATPAEPTIKRDEVTPKPSDKNISIPETPDVFKEKAKKLPPILDGTTKGLLKDSSEISIKYNDLAARYNSLLKMWECVKRSVNSQDKIDECLK